MSRAGRAVQVADVIETMRSQNLFGISGLNELELDSPLQDISTEARHLGTAVVNSIGFEGNCYSVVISNANLN
jgi:hypothetical protein